MFAALVMLWANAAAAQTFTLTLQPNTIPAGTENTAYSQLITAVGGNAPYTFAVTSGSLPPGLTLTSAGLLSGTPTTPASYSFTLTATDSTSNTGFRPYVFSIGAQGGVITISPPSLPPGSQSVAYSQTLTASGGSGGYVFSVSAGSLPPGLTLSSGGTISGTPTSGGSFSFTAFVRDSNGNTETRAYTLNVGTNSLTVNPGSLPNGTLGAAYSQTVSASGGTGPYTFARTGGTLPNGLSLDTNTGDITGTPTVAGPFSFTIRATDSINNVGSRTYNVTIGSNILTVNPATLPNGTTGTPYSQTVTASGGTGGYSFAVTAGALPAGLTLSAGGTISGTPTASGAFSVTIGATDSSSNTGSRAYTLTINAAPLTINPSSLPAGTNGVAYSQTIVASGGTAPYSYAVVSGSLPPGLSLNGGSGVLNGTPTAGGAYSFTVQATDVTPNTGTRAYTLNIGTNSLTVSPGSVPNGTVGTAYNQTLTASGGTGPYTFALTAGALPPGVSLSSGGAITGAPTGSGAFSFTAQATDSLGNTGSHAYSFNVGTNSLTVNPASLPNGTLTVPYTQTVVASGGTGPYTYAVSSGALPSGLSLNASSGAITGTPTAGGAASFSIRAVDSLGNAGSRAYAVNIGTVSLIINPATLPAAVVGRNYSQTVVATGGTGPYIYSVSAGALPPGLSLNASTGIISGTPTSGGAASFTIQALDANGNLGSRAYSLNNRPDPALDPEVIGLVNAQVSMARRFASTQIDNVSRHMESLHDHFDPCSVDWGVTIPQSASANAGAPYSASPGIAARSYEPNSPAGQIARRTPNAQECTGWGAALSAWVSGSAEFGQAGANGLAPSNKFSTSGLTAGVDGRVFDNFIVGFAVGYGSDRTDVSTNGTKSSATGVTGTLYASYKPFDPWFIDAALGFGTLGYDNRRFVSDDGSIVSGSRQGTTWFGSVSTGYEKKYGAFRISPYVRADYMVARLNSYSEQGTSAELLTYNDMRFHSLSGTVGLRGSYDLQAPWGVLTPMARVEYRQSLNGSFQQPMYYSDLGASMTSVLNQGAASQGSVNTSVGVRARSFDGIGGELEYGVANGAGKLQAQTVRASLKMAF